jgi:hypothetical protein
VECGASMNDKTMSCIAQHIEQIRTSANYCISSFSSNIKLPFFIKGELKLSSL